jgi:hypothetical protein
VSLRDSEFDIDQLGPLIAGGRDLTSILLQSGPHPPSKEHVGDRKIPKERGISNFAAG